MNRKQAFEWEDSLLPFLIGDYASHAEICGSYRRGKNQIGDLDVLVANCNLFDVLYALKSALNPNKVKFVPEALAVGDSMMRVRIAREAVMEFTNVPDTSWGAGLIHCTGSARFNIELRTYAKQKGYLLNQYGLWYDNDGEQECLASESEDAVFACLGLNFIPPKERESFWKIKDEYKRKPS